MGFTTYFTKSFSKRNYCTTKGWISVTNVVVTGETNVDIIKSMPFFSVALKAETCNGLHCFLFLF